jgi:hypothetical protein
LRARESNTPPGQRNSINMNIAEMTTRLRMITNGFDEAAYEELSDEYFFAVINQAILDLRRQLRTPIKEGSDTLSSGTRTVTLPSDWLEFPSETAGVRMDSGTNSEGVPVIITGETTIPY